MSDKRLIKLVSLYPALYNASSSQYKDNTNRHDAWREIANQLNTTVEDVREKWAKLRNCFTNALKRRQKKSGRSDATTVPWKYEKQMQFLVPHLKANRNGTNFKSEVVEIIDEDSTQYCDLQYLEESTPSPSPNLNISASSIPSRSYNIIEEIDDKKVLLKSSHDFRQQIEPETDEDDHFFLSMGKQLKKLPETDQSEIKFQLHKLIHESEMKMLKNNERILGTPTKIAREPNANRLSIKRENFDAIETRKRRYSSDCSN